MICQHCNKKEATTHFKQNINGEKTEMYLCSDCAKELGVNEVFEPITMSSFFGNFLGASTAALNSLAGVDRCSFCGSSFNDIVKSGKVGCANCYDKFYDRLSPSIEKLHGKTKHIGKTISYTKTTEEVSDEKEQSSQTDKLKAELKKAIKEENFEKAAELRDKIRELSTEDNK